VKTVAMVIFALKFPSMNETKVENGMSASGFAPVVVVGVADARGRSMSPNITAIIWILTHNMAIVGKSKMLQSIIYLV
jgi:hypothetical protein